MKSKENTPAIEQQAPQDTVGKDYLLGLFDPSEHEDFVLVPRKYCNRDGHYMRGEAFEAFANMHAAAKEDGIKLIIKSSTRNASYQKGIWERKWTGKRKLSDGTHCPDITDPVERASRILEYSSMPGSSRHHWGTDIDLNAFNNEFFEQGEGKKIYDWLKANAHKYDYSQPYDNKNSGRTGYEEEKWHWSYTPLSIPFTREAARVIHNSDIKGFLGAHTADSLDVVRNYIQGVHPSCK